jgi:hypothetical protein
MRHLAGVEKAALCLAVLFIVVGIALLLAPREALVWHQGYRYTYGSGLEHVSKAGARVYGVLSLLVGGGLTFVVFYGRRKRP